MKTHGQIIIVSERADNLVIGNTMQFVLHMRLSVFRFCERRDFVIRL